MTMNNDEKRRILEQAFDDVTVKKYGRYAFDATIEGLNIRRADGSEVKLHGVWSGAKGATSNLFDKATHPGEGQTVTYRGMDIVWDKKVKYFKPVNQ